MMASGNGNFSAAKAVGNTAVVVKALWALMSIETAETRKISLFLEAVQSERNNDYGY
jgi:hypothetical protein